VRAVPVVKVTVLRVDARWASEDGTVEGMGQLLVERGGRLANSS
jgi:hypothetical protein